MTIVQAARQLAAERHTWDQRAKELISALRPILTQSSPPNLTAVPAQLGTPWRPVGPSAAHPGRHGSVFV
jgi:hypothetical protein